MAERKPRATKEESLQAKIEKNLEDQAKLAEKMAALKLTEKTLKKELNDLKKKAEKEVAAKAKKAAKAQAEKELLKAIKKNGLSLDDVKAKLGI